ncbi:MAG: type II toxin-antitoxin system PemK/MazF family toxin [Rhizobiaceae bacterium]|nr:type II toxin-antitoxin system PemK/MazF family toxin [Rhizobiaceae bacterium]
MKRGDIVTVALSGDFGKPRPALVVQADFFDATATVTVLLISSTLVDGGYARVTVQPSPGNGLRMPSQIMVDKAMTTPREKVGSPIGRLDADTLSSVDRSIALFFGLA